MKVIHKVSGKIVRRKLDFGAKNLKSMLTKDLQEVYGKCLL